ncbi:MCP four helix bundle domain-containing protein, partial [Magnetospirillum aberrantis]
MFARLRIPARLAILTIAMGVFLAAVAGLGITGMNSILASLRTVYEDRTTAVIHLAEVQDTFLRIRLQAIGYRDATDPEVQARIKREIATLDARLDESWSTYRSVELTAGEARIANELERTLAAYRDSRDRYFAALAAGDMEKAREISRTEGAQAGAALEKSITEDFALQVETARQEYEKGRDTSRTSVTLALVAAGLALLIGGGLAWGIVSSITAPLNRILGAMGRLAHGELEVEISGQDRVDEVGDIAKA